MDGPLRWVVAILVAAAIIALVAFARGAPEHGEPTAPPAADPGGRKPIVRDEASAGRGEALHRHQQAAFIGVAALMVGAGVVLSASAQRARSTGGSCRLAVVPARRRDRRPAGLFVRQVGAVGAKFPSAGGVAARVRQPGVRRRPTSQRWSPGWTYIANGIVTAMVALSFGSYASSAFAGDNAAWVKSSPSPFS